MSALGEAIRTRRRSLNLSQRALGERASLATSHICQIEKGKSMPGVEALAAIAQGLDVTVGDLMHKVTPKAEPLVVDLRDWFAGSALTSMVTSISTVPKFADCCANQAAEFGVNVETYVADRCYDWADAMLKAREPTHV